MYVYKEKRVEAQSVSPKRLYEVGYYVPGTPDFWNGESVHETAEAAAGRVAWLNGSKVQEPTRSTHSYVLTDGISRVAMRAMTEDEADVENRRAEGASDGNFRWQPIVTDTPKPKMIVMTVHIKRDGHDTLDLGKPASNPFEIFMEPDVEYVEFRVDNIEIGRVYRPHTEPAAATAPSTHDLVNEAAGILASTHDGPDKDIYDVTRAVIRLIQAVRVLADERIQPQDCPTQLAKHILAMADDAYLSDHPEWLEIVSEARKVAMPVSTASTGDRP